MNKLLSFLMVLLIWLMASPSAEANWQAPYLYGQNSGYCASGRPGGPIGGIVASDVRHCPENRKNGAVRQKTPKSTSVKKPKTTPVETKRTPVEKSENTPVKPGIRDAEKADPSQIRPAPERRSRTVLNGNETRLAAPNYLNADCSSGPLPDVRIFEPPKNGAYRTEETSIAAERQVGKPRAACNGKPVNAIALYYKPKPEFTGIDEMGIDVDFRNGTVRRYIYTITVR